jgi:hypothetical protein
MLAFAAEGAVEQLAVVMFAAGIVGHGSPSKVSASHRFHARKRCRGYIARSAIKLQRRPAPASQLPPE